MEWVTLYDIKCDAVHVESMEDFQRIPLPSRWRLVGIYKDQNTASLVASGLQAVRGYKEAS